MPLKTITPKIINYSKDKTFQCLLNDIKISLNYLEQYNGKIFEDTDYIPPINTTKMQWIKDYLNSALSHIKTMEDNGVWFI